MTTLSSERVDVLTETVIELSRSAQLSMSLANLANNKDLESVEIAAMQDSFLQTVLALHNRGRMEKNFLLWLASCLQHEILIVIAEDHILEILLCLWRDKNVCKTQLQEQIVPLIHLIFTKDLLTIAEINGRLPEANRHSFSVFFAFINQIEQRNSCDRHLFIHRLRLCMEFIEDLWFDYGIELPVEHFLPFWIVLPEDKTAAIERVVYHLLSYNDTINSFVMRQIVHVLVLVTLSIKYLQEYMSYAKEKVYSTTSQELERLLTDFILDDDFLFLTSKVNVMDYQGTTYQFVYHDSGFCNIKSSNTITSIFLYWVQSRDKNMLYRFILKYYGSNTYEIPFEQLVRYLPPFALLDCYSFDYQFDWSQNIRIAIPQLTQKEAHIFKNHAFADIEKNIYYYVWSSKVKNLSGSADLALALYHFKGRNFNDLAFWESIIRFCIANETVLEQYVQEHDNTYTNLFGYLSHKRQEEGNRFEMKGRSLRIVMQQADEWYQQIHTLENNIDIPILSWTGAAYQPYELEEGNTVYTIVQLTNNAELQAESNALRHCVSGYGQRCVNGYCSIWSLRVSIDGGEAKSVVTIEVNKQHNIVQAKTAYNAQPIFSHLAIVKQWAAREGIALIAT